jgi:hypothetical protein
VEIELSLPRPVRDLNVAVAVKRLPGDWLAATSPFDVGVAIPIAEGLYRTRLTFPPAFFMPKRYALTFACYEPFRTYEKLVDELVFDVVEVASPFNRWNSGRVGDLQIFCQWNSFIRACDDSAESIRKGDAETETKGQALKDLI